MNRHFISFLQTIHTPETSAVVECIESAYRTLFEADVLGNANSTGPDGIDSQLDSTATGLADAKKKIDLLNAQRNAGTAEVGKTVKALGDTVNSLKTNLDTATGTNAAQIKQLQEINKSVGAA